MGPVQTMFPQYVRRQDSASLDEDSWHNLPDFVIKNLIFRLPFRDRVTLRRVCKSWLEICSSVVPGDEDIQSLPVMVGDSSLTIYNVRRNDWKQKSMKTVYMNDAVKGFESAGGLICAITKHSEKLLIIHNPITNKTKYLLPPESFKLTVENCMKPWLVETQLDRYLYDVALHYDGLTGLYRGVIGFICDEQKCNYTIIMACTNLHASRTTHVYNSLTREWTEGGKVPERVTFWYGGDNRIVCNGSLYCLARGRNANEGCTECILAKYVLCSMEWIFYPVPEVRDGSFPFLVEHRKSVIFITHNSESETLNLYRLNEMDCSNRNYWQLVSRLPRFLWTDFTAKADAHFSRCVGQKDLIYLTGRKRKGSGVVALVFDPTRGIFKWLPHLADDYLIFQLRCYKPSFQPV